MFEEDSATKVDHKLIADQIPLYEVLFMDCSGLQATGKFVPTSHCTGKKRNAVILWDRDDHGVTLHMLVEDQNLVFPFKMSYGEFLKHDTWMFDGTLTEVDHIVVDAEFKGPRHQIYRMFNRVQEANPCLQLFDSTALNNAMQGLPSEISTDTCTTLNRTKYPQCLPHYGPNSYQDQGDPTPLIGNHIYNNLGQIYTEGNPTEYFNVTAGQATLRCDTRFTATHTHNFKQQTPQEI